MTLGGDGTILHVASLFSATKHVPPVLSFAMGTLGFLGEWRWSEHALAVQQLFSGEARVLRRQRLKVGVYDAAGKRVSGEWEYERIGGVPPLPCAREIYAKRRTDAHAMNEVIIHRGMSPHLAIVDVFVDNRFLTEAVV
jgi:NADH kinase